MLIVIKIPQFCFSSFDMVVAIFVYLLYFGEKSKVS